MYYHLSRKRKINHCGARNFEYCVVNKIAENIYNNGFNDAKIMIIAGRVRTKFSSKTVVCSSLD